MFHVKHWSGPPGSPFHVKHIERIEVYDGTTEAGKTSDRISFRLPPSSICGSGTSSIRRNSRDSSRHGRVLGGCRIGSGAAARDHCRLPRARPGEPGRAAAPSRGVPQGNGQFASASTPTVERAKAENVSGQFDVITGRAVAPPRRFLGDRVVICRAPSTIWVLPKGRNAKSELAERTPKLAM